ncbi:unnamed protein product [Oppiella nova]|uniref:Uncharacterized protein n=1 Tax=Oppiella nova TaxID=334625 RepID=A0A7R9M3B9_9ACAR|nr:unnamed protein product [Oppiella nova]CAG2169950.1 unnamed protein product [Oppiella nova]
MAVVFGVLYYGQGYDYSNVSNINGALNMILQEPSMAQSMVALSTLIGEEALLCREHHNRTYALFPYILATIITQYTYFGQQTDQLYTIGVYRNLREGKGNPFKQKLREREGKGNENQEIGFTQNRRSNTPFCWTSDLSHNRFYSVLQSRLESRLRNDSNVENFTTKVFSDCKRRLKQIVLLYIRGNGCNGLLTDCLSIHEYHSIDGQLP